VGAILGKSTGRIKYAQCLLACLDYRGYASAPETWRQWGLRSVDM